MTVDKITKFDKMVSIQYLQVIMHNNDHKMIHIKKNNENKIQITKQLTAVSKNIMEISRWITLCIF